MAKLPGVLDIGVPAAPETRPIGSYDTTPWARGAQALAQGEEAVGRGVSRLGAGVGDLAIDQNRWEYAQAHAGQAADLVNLHANIENDRTYMDDTGKTMPVRYAEQAKEINQRWAGQISDPNMRARFNFETQPAIQGTIAKASVHGRALWNNQAVADEEGQFNAVTDKAVTSTDDSTKTVALDSINSRIDGLVTSGALTPEQGLAQKKARVGQFATADFLAAKNSNDPQRVQAAMDRLKNSDGHLYDVIDPVLKQRLLGEGQVVLDRHIGEAAGADAIAQAAKRPIAGGTLPPDTAAFFRARSGARVDGLNPTFADGLMRAAQDFEAQNPGRRATFESLKRTTDEQAQLYQRYRTGQGGLAAPPGQSRHEFGLAADVPDGAFQNWLHQNAPRYGLEFLKGRAFENDPGHVQMTGGAPQGATFQPAAFGGQSGRPTGAIPAGTVSLPPAAALRADAYRDVLDNPNITEEARTHALTYIDRTMRAAEIADNQNAKAAREASDQAAGGYVTEIGDMLHSPNPDWVAFAGKINHDPNLEWRTKQGLMEHVRKLSGEEQAIGFGPGYMAARRGLFSSPDDPEHISDFGSLMTRDDITPAGLRDLHERLQFTRSDVDRTAIERRVNFFLAHAKGKLSFEQDMGPIKIRDPEGEGIFNSEFAPSFVKQASALAADAQKSGDQSKLDAFLSRDNVDKMIRSYRDPRKMEADRMRATGEASTLPDQPNAPPPPTPDGIEPAGWVPLVSRPPMLPTGQAATRQQWGQALELLANNPTPETKAAFDRWFGAAGFKADDVLAKLKPPAKGEAPAKEAPPPPPAAQETSFPRVTGSPMEDYARRHSSRGPAAIPGGGTRASNKPLLQ